jgi:RHS repeat-associated protein
MCIQPGSSGVALAAGLPVCTSGVPPTQASANTSTWFTANNQLSAAGVNAACGQAGSYYDCAGNLVQVPLVPGATQTYDAENRITTVSGGTSYVYDADGRRVEKTSSGNTTVYVYDAAGHLAAEYSTSAPLPPCETCYLTADYLGSTRLVTDETGAVVARHDFFPFGEEIPAGTNGRSPVWAASDAINQKFTGKERDAESGLDYFGARYYGGGLGRFTSPDPSNLSVDFWLPQTWNRYAYALNNPLSIVDRNGLWPTYIHNEIINEAFPGLSASQLKTLQKASYDTDYNNRVNGHGPQDPEDSFVHGMSDGVHNQDPMAAQAMGDNFIAENESSAEQAQADWIASGNTGIAPTALTAFGNALHTVTDRTSPAHAGNQRWNGTAGVKNKIAALDHIRRELHPTSAQRANAEQAAQNAFFRTFGWELFLRATQQAGKACVSTYDSASNTATTTCQ